MKKIEIRAALAAGWSAFMLRPLYLFTVTLAFFILFAFSMGETGFSALAYVLYGGYLLFLIKHFRGGVVLFDDLFDIDRRWISYAFLALIKGLLIVLGTLCFIVPGIYLMVRWMFAEYLVIDQGMRPLEALRASSKMTEGARLKLFLFILVGILLTIVGTMVLGVGAVVAFIVVRFAVIKLYEEQKSVLVEVQPVVDAHINDEELVA
jgi:uncharacterized membrane protein